MRTCVASQMVSMIMKWLESWSGPYFFMTVVSNSLPMRSVSPLSIVVWFAMPMLESMVSGSKPGDTARERAC